MNRRDCESNFTMSNYYVMFKVLIKWFFSNNRDFAKDPNP